jgi:hypothetical protein
MTGEDSFDRAFYDEISSCLFYLDQKLVESVNGQWSGFKEYAATRGNPGIDDWKQCELEGVKPMYFQAELMYFPHRKIIHYIFIELFHRITLLLI